MCPAARQRRSRNAFSIAAASSSAFLSAIILKKRTNVRMKSFLLFRLVLYHILLSISQNVLPIRLINVFLRYKPFQFRRIRPERKKTKTFRDKKNKKKHSILTCFCRISLSYFVNQVSNLKIENECFRCCCCCCFS